MFPEDSPEIVAFNVEPVSDLIPKEIAKELYIAIKENQMRGLIDNQVFFAEMLHCLNYKLDPAGMNIQEYNLCLTVILSSCILSV